LFYSPKDLWLNSVSAFNLVGAASKVLQNRIWNIFIYKICD